MRSVRRVAVVGAGAAGLAAAQAMKSTFEVEVFEASKVVGGVWVYDHKTDSEHGPSAAVHSSMYASLRTNLPKQVMGYPGFPFDRELPSFPSHTDVAEYLEKFATEHCLHQLIQFGHRVVDVTPSNPNDRWTDYCVTVERENGMTRQDTFDAVVVCNGHYSRPKIPSLLGQESFPGDIIHSHNYRRPDLFRGKRVVVLGAGASGTDIALELSRVAAQVYLSHRGDQLALGQTDDMQLIQTAPISQLLGTGSVMFSDGSSQANIDILLLCTGYQFQFGFLSPKCGIHVEENVVQRLYNQMLSIDLATLAFVGLPWKVAPFPLFMFQSAHIARLWSKQLEIPSVKKMELELQNDIENRRAIGLPTRYGHMLGEMQWEYNRRNADAGELPGIEPVVQKMYFDAGQARRRDAIKYRERDYEVISDTDFRVYMGDNRVDVTPPI